MPENGGPFQGPAVPRPLHVSWRLPPGTGTATSSASRRLILAGRGQGRPRRPCSPRLRHYRERTPRLPFLCCIGWYGFRETSAIPSASIARPAITYARFGKPMSTSTTPPSWAPVSSVGEVRQDVGLAPGLHDLRGGQGRPSPSRGGDSGSGDVQLRRSTSRTPNCSAVSISTRPTSPLGREATLWRPGGWSTGQSAQIWRRRSMTSCRGG